MSESVSSFSTTSPTVQNIQAILLSHPSIQLGCIKAHVGRKGNEAADSLAKQATTVGSPLQYPASLRYWQKEWGKSLNGRNIHQILPKVSLTPPPCNRQDIIFASGHGPFPSYFKLFHMKESDHSPHPNPSRTSKQSGGIKLRKINYAGLKQGTFHHIDSEQFIHHHPSSTHISHNLWLIPPANTAHKSTQSIYVSNTFFSQVVRKVSKYVMLTRFSFQVCRVFYPRVNSSKRKRILIKTYEFLSGYVKAKPRPNFGEEKQTKRAKAILGWRGEKRSTTSLALRRRTETFTARATAKLSEGEYWFRSVKCRLSVAQ
ncbi:hypothetical protein AVEN_119228-1 [Araneus ventricosus]|uniref:RNase H type-1 domain-containing protein n=1 Tax=Araneus ventricosus TaxID=182803 RepID=A0A4Y2INB0_ARAVE|nr:hypothetical protein AVEN_119228-1 [Araneus ventricosus]